jgi:type I restriction enzyme, S subunit
MSFPRYPAYKDSGVEWLGEVPADWSVLPAKYGIASKSGGQTTKNTVSAEPGDGLFPAFSASGQDIWMEEFEFEGPALVLSAVGARCGKTFKADGRWGVVANTHCLFPRAEFNRDFLWYLTNREDWWERGGTAQPFVKVSETLARKWVFPTPCEQARIAQFLDQETDKIDALVAEQERLIELLKEKRQAVISHAVTKGLDPSVPMKDSDVEWLGEVPAHWAVVSLKRLVAESVAGPYGASLTKAMYSESGYRVYGQQQVIADDFSIGEYFISEEKYAEMRRYTVYEGDVLVSVMGTIGKVAVVTADTEPGIINPRLVRYRCNERVLPRYIQRVLMCQKHQEHLSFESNGTTMEGLNMVTLGKVPVPTPPLNEQKNIFVYLKDRDAEFEPLIEEASKTIQLLQERRTALISAAVTGQIDVRGWTPAETVIAAVC